MTTWDVVLLSSALVLALKAAGYLVPARVIEHPATTRIAPLLTVALLAALVVTQTIQGSGRPVTIDARLPALVVAGALLAVRAPFIVVVVAAAGVAAGIRLLGWLP